MFEIRILPNNELGPEGQRLGRITIGNFTERFACYPVCGSVEELQEAWVRELRKLISGSASVALVHDPRFAWVFYREGQRCYVQQVFSESGDFSEHLAQHVTVTEEGDSVSEWSTSLADISRFVDA